MSTQPLALPPGATLVSDGSPPPMKLPPGATLVSMGGQPAQGPAAPKEDKSALGKLWDWANRGIISKDTIVGAMTGMTPEELNKELSEIPNESPAHAGIREFIRGTIQDTAGTASGFTSPLAVGTAGLGAAGKIPGAVGTIAKVGTGLVGAGFAAKGTGDVANAISNNDKPFADRVQQGLQGGAMVAGGMAGAGAAGKGLVAQASSLAPEMYRSALKPSTTIPKAQASRMISTGLNEEIPISQNGLAKLNELVSDLNDSIKTQIGSGQGKTVNKFAVASRLSDTAKNFAVQVNPEADLNAVSESGNEFIRNTPNDIPAADAQAMKQGTYRQLGDKAYGEMGTATKEAQKALARGIKEELANQFPELNNLNAAEGRLLDLKPVLEKALNRIGNHQLLGIGTPLAGAGVKAVTGSGPAAGIAAMMKMVLDNPMVKSRLAISLNKAGVSLPESYSRVAAYGNALAAAANASNPNDHRDQTSTQ